MNTEKFKVVIADDDETFRDFIDTVLSKLEFEIVGKAADGEEAENFYRDKIPDLMLLDINMPKKTGIEVLENILKEFPNAFIIILTALSDMQNVSKCINLGAAYFILKDTPMPKMISLILEAIKNFKAKKIGQDKNDLNEDANLSPKKLIDEDKHIFSDFTIDYLITNYKKMINDSLYRNNPSIAKEIGNIIVEEIDNKFNFIFGFHQLRIDDEFNFSHSINVATLTALMGKILEFNINIIKEITLGALLHDIGKVKMAAKIVNSPHNLNQNEIKVSWLHTQFGYQVVKAMELDNLVAEIVMNHHERIDGNGYPRKKEGNEISIYAQIVSIADIYDNLVSNKPEKKAFDHNKAINIMLLEGTQAFDHDLLHKFACTAVKKNYALAKEQFRSLIYV